ncbi:transmembrane protease serine 11D-like [Haemaphysalis longicornis]
MTGGNCPLCKLSVFLAVDFSKTTYYCSAVILTEVHLLTTASCVYRNGTYPTWAKAYYESTVRLTGDYVYVDKIRIHTDYTSRTFRNDIALMTVERPLDFTRYTKPVCVPTSSVNVTDTRVTVPGWGRLNTTEPEQSTLYRGFLRGMDGEDCYRRFKAYGYDDLIMFCAERDRSALCEGDTAAPALVNGKDGLTYLLGLALYGYNCGSGDAPSVFLRVDAYAPWIHHKLNRLSEYHSIPVP